MAKSTRRKAPSSPILPPAAPVPATGDKGQGTQAKRKSALRVLEASNGHKVSTKMTDQQAYDVCREITPDHADYEFAERLCKEYLKVGYLLPKQLPYLHSMAINWLAATQPEASVGKIKIPKRRKKWKPKPRQERVTTPNDRRTTVGTPRGTIELEWFVLAVEPGADNRVARDIRKKKLIEGMSKYVKKVAAPFVMVEKIIGEDKGRMRRILVRELKFPGYLICNLRYTVDVYHLIRSIRGVFGFLPILMPLPSTATEEQVLERENTKPTALDSEEAAELLIQMQVEAAELKKEKKKATVKFKVGDECSIIAGAFKGTKGIVKEIKGPKHEPNVLLEVTLLSRIVPVTVKQFELKRVD